MPNPNTASSASPQTIAAAAREVSASAAEGPLKTQILLIDEAGILRDGLCALLQSDRGLEVAAVAGSRREAMQALAALSPHLVIMDFSVTLKTGPETLSQLKRWPRLQVLVLTLRHDEPLIAAALRAGADGWYVLKNESRTELFLAVQRITAGHPYISPPALQKLTTPNSRPGERPSEVSGNRRVSPSKSDHRGQATYLKAARRRGRCPCCNATMPPLNHVPSQGAYAHTAPRTVVPIARDGGIARAACCCDDARQIDAFRSRAPCA